MADKYILVDADQNIYYFEKKGLFDFLNEVDDEENDMVNYRVLESFPLPLAWANENISSSIREEFDEQHRPFGNFCPFDMNRVWPQDAVLILKNNSIFVPKKREVKKEIIRYEYGDPTPTRSRPSTKRAASKKSTKK